LNKRRRSQAKRGRCLGGVRRHYRIEIDVNRKRAVVAYGRFKQDFRICFQSLMLQSQRAAMTMQQLHEQKLKEGATFIPPDTYIKET